MIKQFKVLVAYDNYKKGDLVSPPGLWRDYLQSYGYIAMQHEPFEATPAVEPELAAAETPVPPDDEPIDDIEDDDEPSPLIRTATITAPVTQAVMAPRRGPGRPRRAR